MIDVLQIILLKVHNEPLPGMWMTKICHINPSVISDIISNVKKVFGDIYVVRGNQNTLLGINIEIKENIIHVDMVKQLEECIEILGETSVLQSHPQQPNNYVKEGNIPSN